MIHVVDYDPSWPKKFEALKEEYSLALAQFGVEVVAIEHVGSTSVPGLAAKPVIDCDIVVTAKQMAPASDVLVGLGFQPLGELGPAAVGLQGAVAAHRNQYLCDLGRLSILAEPSSGTGHAADKL